MPLTCFLSNWSVWVCQIRLNLKPKKSTKSMSDIFSQIVVGSMVIYYDTIRKTSPQRQIQRCESHGNKIIPTAEICVLGGGASRDTSWWHPVRNRWICSLVNNELPGHCAEAVRVPKPIQWACGLCKRAKMKSLWMACESKHKKDFAVFSMSWRENLHRRIFRCKAKWIST